MNRFVYRRNSAIVRLIDPIELEGMNEDTLIIVNRIRINSKLVECEIKEIGKQERSIMTKAIKAMKIREAKERKTVMGPAMTVGDIKKLFPNYSKLPRNSFAIIE